MLRRGEKNKGEFSWELVRKQHKNQINLMFLLPPQQRGENQINKRETWFWNVFCEKTNLFAFDIMTVTAHKGWKEEYGRKFQVQVNSIVMISKKKIVIIIFIDQSNGCKNKWVSTNLMLGTVIYILRNLTYLSWLKAECLFQIRVSESLYSHSDITLYKMWLGHSVGFLSYRPHPLLHSPNACNSQGWARSKPGTQNSIQVSHVGGRDSTTWVTIHCLSGCPVGGGGIRCGVAETQTGHYKTGCRHPKWWLRCLLI